MIEQFKSGYTGNNWIILLFFFLNLTIAGHTYTDLFENFTWDSQSLLTNLCVGVCVSKGINHI